jgi:HD superfamily phosphohydrolase
MSQSGPKLIRDVIHGYIEVDEAHISGFIDTPLFQRLRRIEQTSMRCLYPCAHHDRFIHSLGVYHLAKRVIAAMKRRGRWVFGDRERYSEARAVEIENSFMIACLLHDIGHAPFSHTLEYLYKNPRNNLDARIAGQVGNQGFHGDFMRHGREGAAPHEKTSAIVIGECFSKEISSCADVELVIRMVLGCFFGRPINEEQRSLNPLIELVHGEAIDLDKLDYIGRDTFASGVRGISLDLDRLIDSIVFAEHGGMMKLCFDKSAISVVRNVLLAKDYLFKWIYNHHKVRYESLLLKKAVSELCNSFAGITRTAALNAIFSVDNFISSRHFEGYNLYLLSDDDIIYMLKDRVAQLPSANEYLSRKHTHGSAWKNYSELRFICRSLSPPGVARLLDVRDDGSLDRIVADYGSTSQVRIVDELRFGATAVSPSSIVIVYDTETIPYTKVAEEAEGDSQDEYWLLYLPNDVLPRKRDILKAMLLNANQKPGKYWTEHVMPSGLFD